MLSPSKKIFAYATLPIILGILIFNQSTIVVHQSIGVYSTKDFYRQRLTPSQYKNFFSPRRIKRLNFALLDGVGFDFFSDARDQQSDSPEDFWFQSMPKILKKNPQNTFLSKARIQAPSMTVARMEALFGGTIPTVTSFHKNLQSSKHNVDHFFQQFMRNERKLVIVRDDFLSQFLQSTPLRKYAYSTEPCFITSEKTRDYWTIEWYKRARVETDFQVLYSYHGDIDWTAHIKGCKFCEHTRPHTLRTDTFIRNAVQELFDDELFIAMSDHGLSWDGQHGMGWEPELNTTFFAYQQKGLFNVTQVEPDLAIFDPSFQKTSSQFDIVPTISWVFGIPIPYCNLGFIIPDFFFQRDGRDQQDINSDFYLDLTIAAQANMLQIREYLRDLQNRTSKFPNSVMKQWEQQFDDFLLFDYQSEIDEENFPRVSQHIIGVRNFIKNEVQKTCLQSWNLFQKYMYIGIAFLIVNGLLLSLMQVRYQMVSSFINRSYNFATRREVLASFCVAVGAYLIVGDLSITELFSIAIAILIFILFFKAFIDFFALIYDSQQQKELVQNLIFNSDIYWRIYMVQFYYSRYSTWSSFKWVNNSVKESLKISLIYTTFQRLFFGPQPLKWRVFNIGGKGLQLLILIYIDTITVFNYRAPEKNNPVSQQTFFQILISPYDLNQVLSINSTLFFYIPASIPVLYSFWVFYQTVFKTNKFQKFYRLSCSIGVIFVSVSTFLKINNIKDLYGQKEYEAQKNDFYSVYLVSLVTICLYAFSKKTNKKTNITQTFPKKLVSETIFVCWYNILAILPESKYTYLFLMVQFLFMFAGSERGPVSGNAPANTNLGFQSAHFAHSMYFQTGHLNELNRLPFSAIPSQLNANINFIEIGFNITMNLASYYIFVAVFLPVLVAQNQPLVFKENHLLPMQVPNIKRSEQKEFKTDVQYNSLELVERKIDQQSVVSRTYKNELEFEVNINLQSEPERADFKENTDQNTDFNYSNLNEMSKNENDDNDDKNMKARKENDNFNAKEINNSIFSNTGLISYMFITTLIATVLSYEYQNTYVLSQSHLNNFIFTAVFTIVVILICCINHLLLI